MLLITRRTGEAVIINDQIELTVVEIKGGKVKLGFEYPEGSSVYRKELYLKIQEENRAAAGSTGNISKFINKLTTKEKDQ